MNAGNKALCYLPEKIKNAVSRYPNFDSICEIRLRRDLPLSLTTYEGNVSIDHQGRPTSVRNGIVSTSSDLVYVLNRLCEGSVYRHISTIKQGFIISPTGIRVGLCGDCVYDPVNNSISNIESFNGLNIRIPRNIKGAADEVVKFFSASCVDSLLIYSPPGAGKTTLIRDLALRLSTGECKRPLRCAVIDERREIFANGTFIAGGGYIDVMSGYSKPEGMEIAVRVLSPEVIICDEIGSKDDVDAILSAQNSGVIFIATAHADSHEALLEKPNLKKLIESGIFKNFARLYRINSKAFKTGLTFYKTL